MLSKDDIVSFLDRLTAEQGAYEEIEAAMWVIHPGGDMDVPMVVSYSPPVLLLRVKVMELPGDGQQTATLSRRLLEYNASELLHGSYGIEGESVVLTETMELAYLDFEEFLSSYESMTMALASHLRELAPFREGR